MTWNGRSGDAIYCTADQRGSQVAEPGRMNGIPSATSRSRRAQTAKPRTQAPVAQEVAPEGGSPARLPVIGFVLLDRGRASPARLDHPRVLCVISVGCGIRNQFCRTPVLLGNIGSR